MGHYVEYLSVVIKPRLPSHLWQGFSSSVLQAIEFLLIFFLEILLRGEVPSRETFLREFHISHGGGRFLSLP